MPEAQKHLALDCLTILARATQIKGKDLRSRLSPNGG
jgi:hypothetical protein